MFPCTGRWQEKKFPAFDTPLTHSGKRLLHLMEALKGACQRELWQVTAAGVGLNETQPCDTPLQHAAHRRAQIKLRALTTGQHNSIQVNRSRIPDICLTWRKGGMRGWGAWSGWGNKGTDCQDCEKHGESPGSSFKVPRWGLDVVDDEWISSTWYLAQVKH